jgi:hypothetical protein
VSERELEERARAEIAARRAAAALTRTGDTLLKRDPYWPAQVSVLVSILLYLNLPDKLTLSPHWVIPSLEGALLLGLVVTTPWRDDNPSAPRRRVALGLLALVSTANLLSLVLLSHELLRGHRTPSGHDLILAGVEIWITNVLIFAIWFWEMDRGGPRLRDNAIGVPPDFLFPQMTEDSLGGLAWRGNFVDYLYTSFTNATAFSPTDTMPLTNRAKLLMLVQSGAALWTVGLVVARAVNILS